MSALRKNVASQHFGFCLNAKADGTPVTAGGAGTVYIDGGAQAACAGTFTHKGTGQWDYAPTQAETNGTSLHFALTGTGAIQVGMQFFTTAGDPTDAVRGGLTALPNAAANAAGGLPISIAGGLDLDEMNVDIEAIQASTAGLTFTVSNQVDANVLDWKSATAPAMTGDAFARLGAPAGASIAADLAEIEGETDTLITGVNVTQWAGQNALLDANNLPKVDVEAINAVTLAAQALGKSASCLCWGTCSGGTTTTAVVGTLNNPASLTDSGQLIGRTIIFLGNDGTGNVQSQASNVTASTTGATPTITFTAMTHAPANADVFVVF